jgi:hypothetical protein
MEEAERRPRRTRRPSARHPAPAAARPWLHPTAHIHTSRFFGGGQEQLVGFLDTHGGAWPNSEARPSLRIDINDAGHRDGNRNTEGYELINFRAAVSLALNH